MTAILLLLTLLLSLPEALLVMTLSLVVTNLFVGLGIWTVGQFLSYLGIMLTFSFLARLPVIKEHFSRRNGFFIRLSLLDFQLFSLRHERLLALLASRTAL